MINASRFSFADIVLVPFPFTDQSGVTKPQPKSRSTGWTNDPDLVAGTNCPVFTSAALVSLAQPR
jgi:hypothetical protein